MYDLYNKETNIFIPKEETIMNSTATQIAKIISTPNPSAPITTHALAELGNGSMQNGLRRIISYFAAESTSKLRLGRIQGGLVGIIGTAVVAGGIAFMYHETQKKQIETEGKVILNTLQKSANENTIIVEETPSDNVTEESDVDNNTLSEE